jgi:hypothetical protein
MEKVSEVFFSEHGLTSTSASHLADLAYPKENFISVFKQSVNISTVFLSVSKENFIALWQPINHKVRNRQITERHIA